MIFFKILDGHLSKCERSLEEYLLEKKKVKSAINASTAAENRFVVHHYVREKEVEAIISGLKQYHADNIPATL